MAPNGHKPTASEIAAKLAAAMNQLPAKASGNTPLVAGFESAADKTKLDGERGQFIAEMARARGKIAELGSVFTRLA